MARAGHAAWCGGCRPRFLAPGEATLHGLVQVPQPPRGSGLNLWPMPYMRILTDIGLLNSRDWNLGDTMFPPT